MLAVQLVLLVAMLIFTVIVRWTLKNEETSKSDLKDFKSPSLYVEELESPSFHDKVVAPPYECAVCFAFTSTRCSRCKALRYCSSKCQIMHWRNGHKYECHPPAINVFDEGDYFNPNVESSVLCETNSSDSAGGVRNPVKGSIGLMNCDNSDSHSAMPRLSTVTNVPMDLTTRRSRPGEHESPALDNNGLIVCRKKDKSDSVDPATSSGLVAPGLMLSMKKMNKEQSLLTERRKSSASNIEISMIKKNQNSSEGSISGDVHHFESKEVPDVDLLQSGGNDYLLSSKGVVGKSFSETDSRNSSLQPRNRNSSSRLPHIGLKSSLQKVVHSLKSSHHKKPLHQNSLHEAPENMNHKEILQYDAFLKLYCSEEVELKPFGLINCGNSCYANAVLQCLAYTRPLTLYLLRGLHSKECWKEEWCFICELEHLIQKAREGYTPLSPIRILSNISHLGHGREEDAHEFLRVSTGLQKYAVDTMQSVCVQLAGCSGSTMEEATLISMTFGGYLHSKIKCMKCQYNSEMYERMMDLTVEIDGDIRSLEQALRRFTAYEMLEGNNKYHCSRCKSYEKAKKKLSVFEAPNILTIVLKRFQAGTLTKLNKLVQFPHKLDMAPFMSRSSNRNPQYNLYAVVVHLDVMNAAFCGHYVCYVKNYHEEWFKIDDSMVTTVDLKSVLSEEAYVLLYARQSPRATATLKSAYDGKLPDAYLQAVPTRTSGKSVVPNARHKFSDPREMQHQSSRKGYARDSPYLEEWVTHSVESIPRVNSSSEASSLFSYSEEGTCSTPTTKESASVEDFTDYLFPSGGRRAKLRSNVLIRYELESDRTRMRVEDIV